MALRPWACPGSQRFVGRGSVGTRAPPHLLSCLGYCVIVIHFCLFVPLGRMAEMLQSGQGPDGAGAAAANSLNALLRKSKKPSVRLLALAALCAGMPGMLHTACCLLYESKQLPAGTLARSPAWLAVAPVEAAPAAAALPGCGCDVRAALSRHTSPPLPDPTTATPAAADG